LENQKPLNQLPQLFFIPFAGGNCYSFQFLKNYLPDYECITLELPGRGRRMNESFLKDFGTACADIFAQIKKKVSSNRFLIYGHSMGAMITLKVTTLLENININPDRIIVTGSPGGQGLQRTDLVQKY
jgi:external thioesterase TEII